MAVAPRGSELQGFGRAHQATIVGGLRAGDSFGWAVVYSGVRSATVVTDTPCELFCLGLQNCRTFWEMIWLPIFEKSFVFSCFEQSFVMSHFFSTGRRRALTPRLRASHRIFGCVSWLLETCLAARSRQCGASGGSSDSASCPPLEVALTRSSRSLVGAKMQVKVSIGSCARRRVSGFPPVVSKAGAQLGD